MLVVFNKYLVPKMADAIALYPFVFVKRRDLKEHKILMNHERIHLKQQIEMLIVFFYIWYLIEFFVRLIQYKKWHLAYKNISFERECYQNQHNLKYLDFRRFYSWLQYL